MYNDQVRVITFLSPQIFIITLNMRMTFELFSVVSSFMNYVEAD